MTKITSSYATWPLTYIVVPALSDNDKELAETTTEVLVSSPSNSLETENSNNPNSEQL